MAKTVATPTKGLSLGNPTLLLVVLAGIAFGLIQFSVRIGGK